MSGTRVTLTANAQATLTEDDLQCPICVSLLKEPKSLQCGHSFCADCLKDYCRSSEFRAVIKCPVCRHETFCISTVDRLPTNYAVLACIEKIEAANRKPQSLSGVLQNTSTCNQMDVDDSDDASERVQTAAQHFATPRHRPYLLSRVELAAAASLRSAKDQREPLITSVCVNEYTQRIMITDYANCTLKSISLDLTASSNKTSATSAVHISSTHAESKNNHQRKSAEDASRSSANGQNPPKRSREGETSEGSSVYPRAATLRHELRCAVGAPCGVRVLDAHRIALVERTSNGSCRQLVFYASNLPIQRSSSSEAATNDVESSAFTPINSVFLSEGTSTHAFLELTYNAHLLVAFEGEKIALELDSRPHNVEFLQVPADDQSNSNSQASDNTKYECRQYYVTRRCILPANVSSLHANRELDLINVTNCGANSGNRAVRLFDRNFTQLLRIDAAQSDANSTSASASNRTTTNDWNPTRSLLTTDSFLFVFNAARSTVDCYELETFEYSHKLIEDIKVSCWCTNTNETVLIVYDASKRMLFANTLKYALPKASKKSAVASKSDDGRTEKWSRRCTVM